MAEIKTTPIEGYAHLGRAKDGCAVLGKKPRMRVMDIASAYSCEYRPEDILADFPFLSLPEIHQAIAYYLDHRAEIEGEWEKQRQARQRLRRRQEVRG